jgi:hypothetical protein
VALTEPVHLLQQRLHRCITRSSNDAKCSRCPESIAVVEFRPTRGREESVVVIPRDEDATLVIDTELAVSPERRTGGPALSDIEDVDIYSRSFERSQDGVDIFEQPTVAVDHDTVGCVAFHPDELPVNVFEHVDDGILVERLSGLEGLRL